MTNFAIVRENGAIISCGSLPEESLKHMTLNTGETLVRHISIGDPSLHYWDGATVHPMPPRPSPLYTFDYPTKTWQPSPAEIRRKRDQLLLACDWTQLPDVPLATRSAWAAYRQSLRDLTDTAGFPQSVVWPIAPA